jgi:hypothetical protein
VGWERTGADGVCCLGVVDTGSRDEAINLEDIFADWFADDFQSGLPPQSQPQPPQQPQQQQQPQQMMYPQAGQQQHQQQQGGQPQFTQPYMMQPQYHPQMMPGVRTCSPPSNRPGRFGG